MSVYNCLVFKALGEHLDAVIQRKDEDQNGLAVLRIIVSNGILYPIFPGETAFLTLDFGGEYKTILFSTIGRFRHC